MCESIGRKWKSNSKLKVKVKSVIECEKNELSSCYKRFTNKTHLTRAMKKKENLKEKPLNDATVPATCRVTRTQNKPV